MKISLDIDCTPEELRRFFGLPDVAPLQARYLEAMDARLKDGVRPEDVEKLMQLWITGAGTGLEQFQTMMAQAMRPKGKG